jgi:NADH:ubiquinone oxidoreductase subunit E/ferredoxin
MTTVIIMIAILLVITVLLIIADKLLVSYGTCRISVKEEEETKAFEVQGGGNLLTALLDNGISVPAACAGRGSCGYCKVNLSQGGGQMLPTEEIFISKEEERVGTRLACQVKIKEDIELYIPDLITTVKTMVKNGTFDTRLDWRFVKTDKPEEIPEDRKISKADKKTRLKVDEIIEKHINTPGAVMPILQDVNQTFNYLPEPVLRYVAKSIDIPLSVIFRIATFYNAFSLEPRGKFIITICTGTACHVKGASNILASFEDQLNIKSGNTTENIEFTLDAVRCIGCCGLAPVLTINDDVHGLVTKKKVPELIEMYKET